MTDNMDTEVEAERLEEPVDDARELAVKLGLEPYDVKYWIVDHDEMNQLIAYGGFQTRYPHWRWGMQYDHQRKKGQLGMGKAFEIVNNDDPSNAFLQVSNNMADQKAVITHVEAHADFFANNEWYHLFGEDGTVNAVSMLAQHAKRIEEYMEDPDIDREDVEEFIDSVTCLMDNIAQYRDFPNPESDDEEVDTSLEDNVESLGFADEIEGQVFGEDWIEEQSEDDTAQNHPDPEEDVLKFLLEHGEEYDEERERAVEMADWKREVLRMLRKEAYYFAPQKMTKVCNEGWAAYWESLMMGDETFAQADEFVTYADHMSKVLGAPGLNPYQLGMELWEYAENLTNRAEVVDKLLRVEGVTWRNLFDEVDIDEVLALLEPDELVDAIDNDSVPALRRTSPDPRIDDAAVEQASAGDIDLDAHPWKALTYEGLAERHYSLVRPQNRAFLGDISRSDLEERARYILDRERYATVEAAIADVDYTAGWDRMRDIRASHNDVTLLDEFLTEEFVKENGYFAYEHSKVADDFRVSSTDYEDVKKKLLLEMTNFGKPTIVALDHNFQNANELLLGHMYNGIMLDMDQALKVLERMYDLWGRPVNLATIVKDYEDADADDATIRMGVLEGGEPEMAELGQRVRFDGKEFEFHPLDPSIQQEIEATDVDYSTLPAEWQ